MQFVCMHGVEHIQLYEKALRKKGKNGMLRTRVRAPLAVSIPTPNARSTSHLASMYNSSRPPPSPGSTSPRTPSPAPIMQHFTRISSMPSPLRRVIPHSRTLASKPHLARGKRLRRGGAIPGQRLGGKLSTEMVSRSESVLESIRVPKPVTNPIHRWRVLRGDLVQVIGGPEKGKRGRVIEVVRASNRVVVEGVGIVKKYVPQADSERKKMVMTEAPIYVSRVAVVCPQTDLPTKVSYMFLEDGTKVRVAKRSGAIIPRPEILKQRRKARPEKDGPKDTSPTVVLERTFLDEDGLYEKYAGFKALIDKSV